MQIQKSPTVHDVIVIGSGAAGGMAAWNLTRKGVNVLMLDAGEKFQRSKFWTHVKPWEAHARRERGEQPPQFYVDNREQPYLTVKDQPFELYRVWGRGGKTNVWGRVSLRYSDVDFTGPEKDGWEIPWPIRYKDIAPYYDRVDQLIGVCGGDDDQDSLPGSKYHLPPPAPRCGERLLQKAAHNVGISIVAAFCSKRSPHRGERLLQKAAHNVGISIVAGRRAVLTRNHNGHTKCHYCGSCGLGCDVGAFFNSTDYLLEPAFKTGKLSVVDNAVAARVLVDDAGKANGVQYFDRYTKAEHRVYGKRIVVGASCIDSTRILLNSKSSAYPNGIGNSSDVIGRFLCEQVRFSLTALMPQLLGGPVYNDDGIGGEHIYMPRFNHRDGRKRDYLRGYGSQFWYTGAHLDFDFARATPGFGLELKKSIKRQFPAVVRLHPYGEVLPYRDNRVRVDGTPVDQYGIPVARIEYKIGDNERKMVAEMYDTCEEILKNAGAEVVNLRRGTVDKAGSAIHEHGTCRMGADPKRSALNGFCQMHDVPNVFVVDGSAFTTASEKNPTLTILALAWRATDYLAEEILGGRV